MGFTSKKSTILIIITLYLQCSILSIAQDQKAISLIKKSIETMGGEEKLRNLKSLRSTGIVTTNLLEQSERPEGPWILSIEEFSEIHDLAGNKLRRDLEGNLPAVSQKFRKLILYDQNAWGISFGGSMNPGSEMIEDPELHPETILSTSLASKDLKYKGSEVIQGVNHEIVHFLFSGNPVDLYLNTNTSLPTGYRVVKPIRGDYFFSIWGNNIVQCYFSTWSILENGIRFPRQMDFYVNSQPWSSIAYDKVKTNTQLFPDSLTLPHSIVDQFNHSPHNPNRLGRNDNSFKELRTGIIQIENNWNVGLVLQEDGVIVIEAPISSGYSALVIREIKKRFPGKIIKAIISTSDAWPHLGGVREYVAQEIPIYILDNNKPIVERLLDAPFISFPDSLQRAPKKAKLNIVSTKIIIGKGSNRLELYPFRTESGERMIMIYFPEHKLLYTSDLGQGLPDPPPFMIPYFGEVIEAVRREKLVVNEIFAMHMGIFQWDTIQRLFWAK